MATPRGARSPGQPGCYVYGIVPADVELAGDVRGVGDPPGQVQLVRHGNLVALVSAVDLTGRLGTPDDLRAHAQVLDATAVAVPVLPLRFGTVVATQDAVAGELLAVYQEAFTAALSPVRLHPNPDGSTLTASSAIVSGRVPVTSIKGATGPGWRRSSS